MSGRSARPTEYQYIRVARQCPTHRANLALRTCAARSYPARAQPQRSTTMAKYGKKAGAKVKRAMHERKRGTLKSGRSGKTVKSRKQAIAIGLSEARKSGAKVPAKKSAAKKSAAKKSPAKKSAA